MSDIDVNVIDGGTIDVTLTDDGVINVSLQDSADINITLDGYTRVAPDHGTASTDEIINVCYGTGDPPAASTTTEGALFVKYEA